jgi:hypothetical protein
MTIHREDGQALILALAFMMFGSLVIGAMVTFAYGSAASTFQLESQRNTVYAVDGATDGAIQAGRADTTVGAYGDSRCHATVPTSPTSPILLTTTTTQNGRATTAQVICTWSQDPLQADRAVTFTTFLASGTTPLVQAQVIYPAGVGVSGLPPRPTVQSWTYCGHSTAC